MLMNSIDNHGNPTRFYPYVDGNIVMDKSTQLPDIKVIWGMHGLRPKSASKLFLL
uniref:Uncharacterized protein n=1 Tax=Arundo donax TaxID=35708 RepID=A0A0A9AQV0_ARUDO